VEPWSPIVNELHHEQPRARASRILVPIDLETLEGAPVSVLPGRCEIEERGLDVLVTAEVPTHRVAARASGTMLTQWLNERRIGFLSWR